MYKTSAVYNVCYKYSLGTKFDDDDCSTERSPSEFRRNAGPPKQLHVSWDALHPTSETEIINKLD